MKFSQLLACLWVLSISCIAADPSLMIKDLGEDGWRVTLKSENNSFIFSDPERVEFQLLIKAEPTSEHWMQMSDNRINVHWKYLILLMAPREEAPLLYAHSFTIASKEIMGHPMYPKDGKPVGLRLWMCDLDQFQKNGIAAMKYQVVMIDSQSK